MMNWYNYFMGPQSPLSLRAKGQLSSTEWEGYAQRLRIETFDPSRTSEMTAIMARSLGGAEEALGGAGGPPTWAPLSQASVIASAIKLGYTSPETAQEVLAAGIAGGELGSGAAPAQQWDYLTQQQSGVIGEPPAIGEEGQPISRSRWERLPESYRATLRAGIPLPEEFQPVQAAQQWQPGHISLGTQQMQFPLETLTGATPWAPAPGEGVQTGLSDIGKAGKRAKQLIRPYETMPLQDIPETRAPWTLGPEARVPERGQTLETLFLFGAPIPEGMSLVEKKTATGDPRMLTQTRPFTVPVEEGFDPSKLFEAGRRYGKGPVSVFEGHAGFKFGDWDYWKLKGISHDPTGRIVTGSQAIVTEERLTELREARRLAGKPEAVRGGFWRAPHYAPTVQATMERGADIGRGVFGISTGAEKSFAVGADIAEFLGVAQTNIQHVVSGKFRDFMGAAHQVLSGMAQDPGMRQSIESQLGRPLPTDWNEAATEMAAIFASEAEKRTQMHWLPQSLAAAEYEQMKEADRPMRGATPLGGGQYVNVEVGYPGFQLPMQISAAREGAYEWGAPTFIREPIVQQLEEFAPDVYERLLAEGTPTREAYWGLAEAQMATTRHAPAPEGAVDVTKLDLGLYMVKALQVASERAGVEEGGEIPAQQTTRALFEAMAGKFEGLEAIEGPLAFPTKRRTYYAPSAEQALRFGATGPMAGQEASRYLGALGGAIQAASELQAAGGTEADYRKSVARFARAQRGITSAPAMARGLTGLTTRSGWGGPVAGSYEVDPSDVVMPTKEAAQVFGMRKGTREYHQFAKQYEGRGDAPLLQPTTILYREPETKGETAFTTVLRMIHPSRAPDVPWSGTVTVPAAVMQERGGDFDKDAAHFLPGGYMRKSGKYHEFVGLDPSDPAGIVEAAEEHPAGERQKQLEEMSGFRETDEVKEYLRKEAGLSATTPGELREQFAERQRLGMQPGILYNLGLELQSLAKTPEQQEAATRLATVGGQKGIDWETISDAFEQFAGLRSYNPAKGWAYSAISGEAFSAVSGEKFRPGRKPFAQAGISGLQLGAIRTVTGMAEELGLTPQMQAAMMASPERLEAATEAFEGGDWGQILSAIGPAKEWAQESLVGRTMGGRAGTRTGYGKGRIYNVPEELQGLDVRSITAVPSKVQMAAHERVAQIRARTEATGRPPAYQDLIPDLPTTTRETAPTRRLPPDPIPSAAEPLDVTTKGIATRWASATVPIAEAPPEATRRLPPERPLKPSEIGADPALRMLNALFKGPTGTPTGERGQYVSGTGQISSAGIGTLFHEAVGLVLGGEEGVSIEKKVEAIVGSQKLSGVVDVERQLGEAGLQIEEWKSSSWLIRDPKAAAALRDPTRGPGQLAAYGAMEEAQGEKVAKLLYRFPTKSQESTIKGVTATRRRDIAKTINLFKTGSITREEAIAQLPESLTTTITEMATGEGFEVPHDPAAVAARMPAERAAEREIQAMSPDVEAVIRAGGGISGTFPQRISATAQAMVAAQQPPTVPFVPTPSVTPVAPTPSVTTAPPPPPPPPSRQPPAAPPPGGRGPSAGETEDVLRSFLGGEEAGFFNVRVGPGGEVESVFAKRTGPQDAQEAFETFTKAIGEAAREIDKFTEIAEPAVDNTKAYTTGVKQLTKRMGKVDEALQAGLRVAGREGFEGVEGDVPTAVGRAAQLLQQPGFGVLGQLQERYEPGGAGWYQARYGGGEEGGGGGGLWGQLTGDGKGYLGAEGPMRGADKAFYALTSGWRLMMMRRLWGMTGGIAMGAIGAAAGEEQAAARAAMTTMPIGEAAMGGMGLDLMTYGAQQQAFQGQMGRAAYEAWGWTQRGITGQGLATAAGIGLPAIGGGAIAGIAASTLLGLSATGVGIPVAAGLGILGGIKYAGAATEAGEPSSELEAYREMQRMQEGGLTGLGGALEVGLRAWTMPIFHPGEFKEYMATQPDLTGREAANQWAAEQAAAGFQIAEGPLGELGGAERIEAIQEAVRGARETGGLGWMTPEAATGALGQWMAYTPGAEQLGAPEMQEIMERPEFTAMAQRGLTPSQIAGIGGKFGMGPAQWGQAREALLAMPSESEMWQGLYAAEQVQGLVQSGRMTFEEALELPGMTPEERSQYQKIERGDPYTISMMAQQGQAPAWAQMFEPGGMRVGRTAFTQDWQQGARDLGGLAERTLEGMDIPEALTRETGGDIELNVRGRTITFNVETGGTIGLEELGRKAPQRLQAEASIIRERGMAQGYLATTGRLPEGLVAPGAPMQQAFVGRGMWDIQDEQTALQHQYQMTQFGFQREQMGMQDRQFMERWGLGRQQMEAQSAWGAEDLQQRFQRQQVQFGWAEEDLAFKGATTSLQYAWGQEDIQESMRYATGRERRQLMKREQRATVSYGMQMGQLETQEERLDQRRDWATEDFERDKGRHNQRTQWSRQSQDLSLRHHRENMGLAERRQDVNEDNYHDQFALQEEVKEKNRILYEAQFTNQVQAHQNELDRVEVLRSINEWGVANALIEEAKMARWSELVGTGGALDLAHRWVKQIGDTILTWRVAGGYTSSNFYDDPPPLGEPPRD